MKYLLVNALIFLAICAHAATTKSQEEVFQKECVAVTMMTIAELDPILRESRTQMQSIGETSCKTEMAKMKQRDWDIGAKLAGCISGIQAGMFKIPKNEKGDMFSKFYNGYCRN